MSSPNGPRKPPRRVFVITFCVAFVILSLISAVLLALKPPVYISEAVVEFSTDQTNSITSTVAGSQGNLQPRILEEMRVIESPELQRRVVQDLHLDAIWGKRYNNGTYLPLSDTLKMLEVRTELRTPGDVPKITIRVYAVVPVEGAQIANSIAQNYCDNFSEPRHVTSRISKLAQSPGKLVHAGFIFNIPKAIIRSLIFSFVAAGIAWGIAIARDRISRIPPPVSGAENTPSRFQKY
ncbi:MAG TPA: hypothetical protein VHC44_12270 [Verrucomicrobiae bacterium]|nr:hypothetical protein [Verrucomicrobiae bacterium]